MEHSFAPSVMCLLALLCSCASHAVYARRVHTKQTRSHSRVGSWLDQEEKIVDEIKVEGHKSLEAEGDILSGGSASLLSKFTAPAGAFVPSTLVADGVGHASDLLSAVALSSRTHISMGKKKKRKIKGELLEARDIALQELDMLEKQKIRIVWFKTTDLRIHDQAALEAAHDGRTPVLHLFIFEPCWYHASTPICNFPRTGARRARFQLESLADLRQQLESAGHSLSIAVPKKNMKASGSKWAAVDTFRYLCREFNVEAVFASHEVCQEELALVGAVRRELTQVGADLQLFWTFEMHHKDDLPFDPVRKSLNSYSAFKRAVEERSSVREPKPAPNMAKTPALHLEGFHNQPLPKLQDILPDEFARELVEDSRAELHWKGGETAALARLQDYLFGSDALGVDYVGATMTTAPGKSVLKDGALSKLSPWLAHGCISPRLIHSEVLRYERERRKGKSTYWILHELRWRDYSRYSSLNLGTSIFKIGGPQNIKPSWKWSQDVNRFRLWQQGKTGYPFIDAFMRELSATGYCNHMGRETAGWFLIQDLGVDWRMGAEWFESTLLDYEPAANWFNWVYRCVPAAHSKKPPGQHLTTLQVLLWGAQHDPHAEFIQRWLPELAPVAMAGGPLLALEPWKLRMQSEQSDHVRSARGAEERGDFKYGKDYPLPAIPPVSIQGHDPAVVAQMASEAQAKQDAWARSTRAKLQQGRERARLSPEPRSSNLGTMKNHIEASSNEKFSMRKRKGGGRGNVGNSRNTKRARA